MESALFGFGDVGYYGGFGDFIFLSGILSRAHEKSATWSRNKNSCE